MEHQIHDHRSSSHPSIRIIEPQTGLRVLPPPEGTNLSKTLRLVLSVLCYHLTCDPTTHHINSIVTNIDTHTESELKAQQDNAIRLQAAEIAVADGSHCLVVP